MVIEIEKKLKKLFEEYDSQKNENSSLIKSIEKQYNEYTKIGEKRINLENEIYFMMENEIKRNNMLIDKLKFEHDNIELNLISNINYLIDKNFDEIFNFKKNIISEDETKGKNPINETVLFSNSHHKKLKKKFKHNKLLKRKRIRYNSIFQNNNKMNGNNDIKIINEEQKNNFLDNIDSSWENITYRELDGKIGPKEPLYCFCNYISYGNMIKCDNPNCKREWFHFQCVGIEDQPKGKWFCSENCFKEYMGKNPTRYKSKSKI